MPLYDDPKGDSDGGYAVSNYRKVNEKLGNIDDLKVLAIALDKASISLVLDFVFNHTSDEHTWPMAAKSGEVISLGMNKPQNGCGPLLTVFSGI